MDPVTAKKTWRTLEPVHGMIYFTPDGAVEYGAIGISSARMGYFASRVAPLGAASAEVVISTFFNFNPSLIRRSVPAVWAMVTPEQVTAARLRAVDSSLRRAFGQDGLASAELGELASLLRTAAEEAVLRPEGRPLFAAHAAQPWPEEPHMVVWHAQTLLREFRGDGHIAALVTEGLSGIEALLSHAASGDVAAEVLRSSRAWSSEEWEAARLGMVERGLLAATADGSVAFTDAGRAQRERIEQITDQQALAPYVALGDERCDRVREIGRPFSKMVIDAGLLVVDPKRFFGE